MRTELLIILLVNTILCGNLNAQKHETCKIPQPEIYHNKFFTALYEGNAFVVKEDTLLLASAADQSLYFYVRRDTTWKLVEQVPLGEPAGAFGYSIDWKGDYIAVGDNTGPNKKYIYDFKGTVFIFHREKGKWSLSQKLISPKDEPDKFGSFVQFTDRFLIVSAPQKTNCTETTKANCEINSISRNYIFELKIDKWIYKEPFPAKDPVYFFGQVRLTDDNEIVMSKDGRVYFFKQTDNHWKLKDSLYLEGESLFLREFDQSYLITSNGDDRKKLHLFTKESNGKWKYLQTLSEEIPRSMDSHYGSSIAIGKDEIAVGAPSERAVWGFQGRVFVYRRGVKGLFERSAELFASDGLKGDCFGKKVFFSGKDLIIMAAYDFQRVLKARREDGIPNSYPGDIYYFKR